MSQLKISHIYNPENQSSEQLIENFVVRNKQYKKIYNEIIDTKLKVSPQHFLIEGQRGTGKTTLLLRLQYEIEKCKSNNNYVVIRLPEEQYGIFTLFHLWQTIVDELEEMKMFKGISKQFDNYTEDDTQNDGFEVINNQFVKNKRRLVLLIDNIGDLFNRFTELEHSRLRDIFHTSNHIQLVGASTITLEYTFKHDKPFFEFFKRIKLIGLDSKETITLIKQLASTYNKFNQINEIINNQPQRIEVLRRMTGGIPRTIVLLFEILIDNNNSVFEDLEAILDKVTPLYKHRMDDLPTQQQSIVNAMALNWDGISSKEIVISLKSKNFTTKKVSAQLKELEKQQIIEGKLINKKDKIYFIKERFFNIWYLMRYGRKKNRQRVLWLIRFLEQWCQPEEIKQRALLHLTNIESGNLKPKTAFYQAEALSAILEDDLGLQNKVLEKTGEYLLDRDNSLEKILSESTLQKIKTEADLKNPIAMTLLGDYYINSADKDEAIELLQEAIALNNDDAMIVLGYYYFVTNKDKKNAEKLFKMATKFKNKDALYILSCLYLSSNTNSSLALEYIETLFSQKDSLDHFNTLMVIQLWNNQYSSSFETFKKFYKKYHNEISTSNLTDYFMLLLAKDQYRLALELFEIFPELIDKIKPVYYALMNLIKHDFPKESLKMGSELESTVNEVLTKVKFLAKKYRNI